MISTNLKWSSWSGFVPHDNTKIPVPTEIERKAHVFKVERREARLHDAPNATGPDFVCKTIVRPQSIAAPPRSPPRFPPAVDRACMCLWYCHPKNTAVLVAPRTDWMLFLAKRMLRRARICITFYAFIGLCGRVRFIVTTRISGTLFFRVCLFTVKVVFFPREITDYKCRLTPRRVGVIVTGPSLAGRLHILVFC